MTDLHEPESVIDAPAGLDRSTRRMVVTLAICGVVLLAVGFGVATLRGGLDERDPLIIDNSVEPAIEMPDLVLTDTAGRPFDLRAETANRTTLLYLGYTNCPDVCPITTAVIDRTLETATPAVRDNVRVVFVSVDPDRDSPEVVRAYLDQFDRSFVGLIATDDQLEQLQSALGAPLATAEAPDPEGGYLVGHASSVYLVGPDSTASFRFPFGTRQSDWERVLPLLVAT